MCSLAEGWAGQGDSSEGPRGWGRASLCCWRRRGDNAKGEPWLGHPSPSLRVLLVHGAVFAALCSNFHVIPEQQQVVGKSKSKAWKDSIHPKDEFFPRQQRRADDQVRRMILTQVSLQIQAAASLHSVGNLSILNFKNKRMKGDISALS